MGHNIHHAEYAENVNKSKVQAEWDQRVRNICCKEGSGGLAQPIRWLDHICKDREEAEQYIETQDSSDMRYRLGNEATISKSFEISVLYSSATWFTISIALFNGITFIVLYLYPSLS